MGNLADRAGMALAAIAAAAGVGGCVSTEQRASWLHVQDARTIASQHRLIVTRSGDQLRVTSVTLLRDRHRLAIAVGLRNVTAHPVNDIPISVGVHSRGGARVYLNRAANLDYFKTHLAVIPAHGALTWVFTGPRRPGLDRRPFAIAGPQSDPPVTVARSIPAVRASVTGAVRLGGSVRVTVTNLSSIPQVGLQLYALAGNGRRYSAAGSATVASLGTGQSTTTRVELVGPVSGAQLHLEALPTLF